MPEQPQLTTAKPSPKPKPKPVEPTPLARAKPPLAPTRPAPAKSTAAPTAAPAAKSAPAATEQRASEQRATAATAPTPPAPAAAAPGPAPTAALRPSHQPSYQQRLSQRIDSHKFYPRRARERGLSGEVQFRVRVDQSGEMVAFHWLDGNRIFHQATLQAVRRALPYPPDPGLAPVDVQIRMIYSLQDRM